MEEDPMMSEQQQQPSGVDAGAAESKTPTPNALLDQNGNTD